MITGPNSLATIETAAAFAAVIDNGHTTICYGWGLTPADAFAAARHQWQGASASLRRHMEERMRAHPLSAEDASDVAEMLETPW